MNRCPNCKHPLDLSAEVAAFLSEPDWTAFYGEPGHRVKRCEGADGDGAFVHFIVRVSGREDHRLARIAAEARPQAEQAALFEVTP